MKKRITSVILAFVMIFTMAASALPAFAANSTSLTITADKTEVRPGDTVTYTVTLGAVKDFESMKFQLNIPAGLTYVAGSGKEVEGLVEKMNSMMAKNLFTEETKVFIIGCDPTYTSAEATILMTLQCTVDANAAGNMTLGFVASELECFDDKGADIPCTLTGATVTAPGAHEHQFDTEWHNDADNHWHECDCGEKSEVAAHTYGEWKVTQEPTETSVGSKERTCTVCGYKQVAEIPMLEHKHQFDNVWHNDQTGHWHECTCGEKDQFATHTYGEWKVTQEPTCTVPGIQKRACTVCGYEETKEIPVVPHQPQGDWQSDDSQHWHICSVCGQKVDVEAHSYTGDYKQTAGGHSHMCKCGKEGPVEPHTYGDWTVTKEATCTEAGSKQHTCTACGYVETIEIPMIPHEMGTDWHSDAENHWHICTVCGTEMEKEPHNFIQHKDASGHWQKCKCGRTTEIEPHTYGAWVVTKEPTETEVGYQERTCEHCGYVDKVEIPKKAAAGSVSGNVVSYGDEKAEVTIELFRNNTEKADYSTTVTGNNAEFSIAKVKPGTYTIRVSKANHAVRTFEITVTEKGLSQNIEINLLGDINLDGETDTRDWAHLYRHCNEIEHLEGYPLVCADVNRDGKVDTRDWAHLYRHCNETEPMW